MAGYEWVGGIANGGFQRPGSRMRPDASDGPRGARLAAELAEAVFYCERCGGSHALAELAGCQRSSWNWKASR